MCCPFFVTAIGEAKSEIKFCKTPSSQHSICGSSDSHLCSCGLSSRSAQATGAYSSMLSIESASPRESGNYTCAASNRVASAQHSAAFHVLGEEQGVSAVTPMM